MPNHHLTEPDRFITRFLDQKLGRWTRLLSWREEIALHLGEQYTSNLQNTKDHQEAWDKTRRDFGDLDDISSKLWHIHKPASLFTRLLLIIAALALFMQTSNFKTFIHIDSALFTLVPILSMLPLVLFGKGMRLSRINQIAQYSALIGCLVGIVVLFMNLSQPERIGQGMALVLICTLYATLLLNISVAHLVIHVSLCIIASIGLIITFIPHEITWSFFGPNINYSNDIITLSIICVAGLLAACARWQWYHIPTYLPRITVAIMITYWITLLCNLSSIEQYIGSFLLGFIPLAMLSVHKLHQV